MSTIPLQANETYNRRIVVRDASGASVAADSTPTGIVYRNGAATAITVTITPLSPIEYDVSFTVPNDAVAGDSWQLLLSTTVNGSAVDRWVQLSQAIFLTSTVKRGFVIRGADGQGQASDSLPTAVVLRNNVAEATTVTITPVGSPTEGRYILSFAVDSGWSLRDELQVKLSATVDGTAVEKLWYMGQIVDSSDVTITISTLNVLSDEQTITLTDTEESINLACE